MDYTNCKGCNKIIHVSTLAIDENGFPMNYCKSCYKKTKPLGNKDSCLRAINSCEMLMDATFGIPPQYAGNNSTYSALSQMEKILEEQFTEEVSPVISLIVAAKSYILKYKMNLNGRISQRMVKTIADELVTARMKLYL